MPARNPPVVESQNGGDSRAIVAARLADLHVGTPLAWHGLTLVPVLATRPAAHVDYETLATALTGDRTRITEVGGWSVPELGVKQAGPFPVLLLDGDHLVGGAQNRVLNTTILVPVGIDFVVPVSCVEQGRWHQTRADFESGGIVPPSLRSRKQASVSAAYRRGARARADQGAVWAEVAETLDRTMAYSPTSDLLEAYVRSDTHIEEARRVLGDAVPGAVGVVAVIEGEARAADLFDKPETLAEFWPRLVRSYVIEAANAPATDGPAAVAAAQALLGAATAAARSATAFPAPGLGEDVRIAAAEVTGASLVHAGVAIHAALFAARANPPGSTPGRGTTRRPSSAGTPPPAVADTTALFRSVFGAATPLTTPGAPATLVEDHPPVARGRPPRAAGRIVHEETIGSTCVQVVEGNLLETTCAAIVVGANKRLMGTAGITGAVERAAGRTFVAERDRRVLAAAPGGFYRGTATITGPGALRDGRARRALIHAIVTKYEHGSRVPTTPDIVYAAIREALHLAETYRLHSVATHPVAIGLTQPGYTPLATALPEVMLRTLFDAIVDHARITRTIRRVQVHERDGNRLAEVVRALIQSTSNA